MGALVEVLAQLSALTREAARGWVGAGGWETWENHGKKHGNKSMEKHGKTWGTSENPKKMWEKHVRKAIGMCFTCFTMENRESWGKSSLIY